MSRLHDWLARLAGEPTIAEIKKANSVQRLRNTQTRVTSQRDKQRYKTLTGLTVSNKVSGAVSAPISYEEIL